jgi:carotenoid cleavage dioxygenase
MATHSKNAQNGNGSIEARKSFPNQPQFSGFMKPCRFEGEVRHLEVHGTIPPELDGTFYRVMPDPQLPPINEDDPVCSSCLA